MGCIVLVQCVLVLRCGLAGVLWYPYAGWGTSAEGVWEYGVEENIWTVEGRGNGGVEETA